MTYKGSITNRISGQMRERDYIPSVLAPHKMVLSAILLFPTRTRV